MAADRMVLLRRAADLRAWLVRGQRRIARDDETLTAIVTAPNREAA